MINKTQDIFRIQSRCGLCCDTCGFKESHGCGGCIETNGNPFHGECPVAKCCQDRGHTHCGECENLPDPCGELDDCEVRGYDACLACDKTACGQLYAYSYAHAEHGDNPPGERIERCKLWAKQNAKV